MLKFPLLTWVCVCICILDFLGGIVVQNLPANSGDTGGLGSSPEWGRSPGRGNGNPLHRSYLENPMDREAWWAAVHEVTKSQTQLRTKEHDIYILVALWGMWNFPDQG